MSYSQDCSNLCWYTILVKVIPYGMKYWRELYLVDSLFLLYSQDWRILIWRTYLEWTLIHKHMRTYASIAGSLIQLPIRQIKFSANISCHTVHVLLRELGFS